MRGMRRPSFLSNFFTGVVAIGMAFIVMAASHQQPGVSAGVIVLAVGSVGQAVVAWRHR